eukprot:scaffold380_cov272-Pinguiococcus_pyrenoidosus.AAC.15
MQKCKSHRHITQLSFSLCLSLPRIHLIQALVISHVRADQDVKGPIEVPDIFDRPVKGLHADFNAALRQQASHARPRRSAPARIVGRQVRHRNRRDQCRRPAPKRGVRGGFGGTSLVGLRSAPPVAQLRTTRHRRCPRSSPAPAAIARPARAQQRWTRLPSSFVFCGLLAKCERRKMRIQTLDRTVKK